ncbi:MAG: glycosyltransferase [Bacteroidia bacterium]
MKVSIIIPAQNEEDYIARLLKYIRLNTKELNVEDIIIVDTFQRDNMIKLAEKEHAKLFLCKQTELRMLFEVGAFEAKGEILYFIKPGCFPPPSFDEKIIHSVERRFLSGAFRVRLIGANFFLKLFCHCFHSGISFSRTSQTSFFITKRLFNCVGGYKYAGKLRSENEMFEIVGNQTKTEVINDYAMATGKNVDFSFNPFSTMKFIFRKLIVQF